MLDSTDMEKTTTATVASANPTINALFKAGAHFAYSKSRRHPSTKPYIFGAKNRVEIFDLEKSKETLDKAKAFVTSIAQAGGMMLFVGGKSEAKSAVKRGAVALTMPYVDGRWIGGTFTNFPEIKKRVDRMEMLLSQKEKGELIKYTKKERLLIDREIDNLQYMFSGIASMKTSPKVMFVIDPKREAIAVEEARKQGVIVVALASSDCDITKVNFPIVGNDSSRTSIELFVNEIVSAYQAGKKAFETKVSNA